MTQFVQLPRYLTPKMLDAAVGDEFWARWKGMPLPSVEFAQDFYATIIKAHEDELRKQIGWYDAHGAGW